MLFSSLSFLYGFLPVTLLVYMLIPSGLRNGWLLIVSLLFYFSGEPKLAWLLAAEAFLGYIAGRILERTEDKKKRACIMVSTAVVELSVLFMFKYAGIWKLPIGISFFTFQVLGYVIDVYRGDVKASHKPVSFMAFISMFPQLIAGPIVRYSDIEQELENRKLTVDRMADGIRKFICGLAKKVLIADSLALLVKNASGSPEESVLIAWLAAVGFLMQLYYDFSGYSDMAVGLGLMLGFHFPENFRYPYMSRSVTEFWRRWHITLGSWFRDYVYIPLGGNRVSRGKWIRNVAVVWLLTGIWHGSTLNYAVWGIYFGCFLIIEKIAKDHISYKDTWFRKLTGHGYTLFVLLVGMVIFRCEDFGVMLHQLRMMFMLSGNVTFAGVESLYYLRSYLGMFLIAIVGCGPFVRDCWQKLRVRMCVNAAGKTMWMIVEILGCIALLMWVTANLVDGSFSPFLYFRF